MRIKSTFHVDVNVTHTPATNSAPRRKDAAVLLAIFAVLSIVGAIAASVMYMHNVARLAQFEADPSCQAPLVASSMNRPSSGACSVERALVERRWVDTRRGSHYYKLALRTPDGALDTLELKGGVRRARALWDAAPVRSEVVVRRFAESPYDVRRHLTDVQMHALSARTAWNPHWRRDNAVTGVVVLGTTAAASLVGLAVSLGRRRRAIASSQLSAPIDT